jgi:hypothetical protein
LHLFMENALRHELPGTLSALSFIAAGVGGEGDGLLHAKTASLMMWLLHFPGSLSPSILDLCAKCCCVLAIIDSAALHSELHAAAKHHHCLHCYIYARSTMSGVQLRK